MCLTLLIATSVSTSLVQLACKVNEKPVTTRRVELEIFIYL